MPSGPAGLALEGTLSVPSREALERARVDVVASDGGFASGVDAGPMPVLSFSLIRASLGARLGLVAVAAAVLWLAVYWALT